MGQGGERSISQGEMMNREVLAKSLVAACDVPAGTEITEAMVRIQSPGQGLQPNRLKDLVGRRLPVAKAQGDVFFPSDLETPAATPRSYSFNQPFGLPVRYHDIQLFSKVSNLDLVEIHLSYKDLEVNLDQVLPERQGVEAFVGRFKEAVDQSPLFVGFEVGIHHLGTTWSSEQERDDDGCQHCVAAYPADAADHDRSVHADSDVSNGTHAGRGDISSAVPSLISNARAVRIVAQARLSMMIARSVIGTPPDCMP